VNTAFLALASPAASAYPGDPDCRGRCARRELYAGRITA
jgi:hypothetical protein